jgi:hypothetical protein
LQQTQRVSHASCRPLLMQEVCKVFQVYWFISLRGYVCQCLAPFICAALTASDCSSCSAAISGARPARAAATPRLLHAAAPCTRCTNHGRTCIVALYDASLTCIADTTCQLASRAMARAGPLAHEVRRQVLHRHPACALRVQLRNHALRRLERARMGEQLRAQVARDLLLGGVVLLQREQVSAGRCS